MLPGFFCVLSFGLLVDRDVGIGVFPEGEEVLIRLERGGLVAHHCLRPAELQTGKRSLVVQLSNFGMVDELLEFSCRLPALP